MSELPEWMDGLSANDWLLDGEPTSDLVLRTDLDWSRAYVDPGPSPAGNPGPYWHVPCKGCPPGVVHRLYPRIPPKWRPLIARAIEEAVASAKARVSGPEPKEHFSNLYGLFAEEGEG